MSEENVTPDAPAGPSPVNYVNEDEISVRAGAGMEIAQEPSNDETTSEVEDTTLTNETKAPEANVEEGGEAEHSSKTISDLGEDRKRLAGELIDLARESESASEKIKELCENDPRMDRLIKTKYGTDYDRIMAGESLAPVKEAVTEVDLAKIKEQAYVEAKAKILMEEAESVKSKQMEAFAQSNGLNTDELIALRENAEILESKHGFERAMEMSLLIVNRDKAMAADKTVPMPSGGSMTPVTKPKEKVDPAVAWVLKQKYPGMTDKQIAERMQSVEGRIAKNDQGHQVFVLGQ